MSASPSAIILAFQQTAVLVLEQDDRTVRIEPGRRTRVLQEKERRQPHDFGLGREEPQQQPHQPDRFIAERRASCAPARRLWSNLR